VTLFCDAAPDKPVSANRLVALRVELARLKARWRFDPSDDDLLMQIADAHAELVALERGGNGRLPEGTS
jgi:hypothetical protein